MRKRALLMSLSLCLFSCGCGTTGTTARSMEAPGTVLGGLLGAGSLALIGAGSHYGGLGRWAAGGGILGALVGWYAGHQLSQSRDPDTAR
ncbi:MAG: hypothetical protein FD124_3721 [Alphaproteobacteria bacterium]|nr:MAG: hypothetical protein FD124_3721 [Alphaproteobacteria bacterium]